jgi:hypothetical protein
LKYADELPFRFYVMKKESFYSATTLVKDTSSLDIGDKDSSEETKNKIKEVFKNYWDMSTAEGEITTMDIKHSIEIMYEKIRDIKATNYRRAPKVHKTIAEKTKKLLDKNLIVKSDSNFTSSVVLVKKKTGDVRFFIDYRRLNKITIKKEYSIPRVEETLDNLVGSFWYAILDLESEYHQIKLDKDSKYLTAFVTREGFFEWNKMSFRLVNAPFTFQKIMNMVLESCLFRSVVVCLDDILIYSKTEEEHVEHISRVLERPSNAQIS